MYGAGIRSSGSSIWRRSGRVKVTVLLAVTVFFLLFLFFTGTRQTGAQDCDCNACHAGVNHGAGWRGCATCHGFPPATGSHLKHFTDSDNILGNYQTYGDTSTAGDYYQNPDTPAPSYLMGCGNCHPIDKAKHQNGTVDVELYNVASPEGSLKAKNPSDAAYNPVQHTCSSVYCHSYNAWTTPGGVPVPWPQNQNDPPVPSNTVATRYYQTPVWGGESLACSGCHDSPPRTDYYTNAGGSGDSHAWLDDWGYEDLHGWNMGYGWPVRCATCHNDTVREYNTFSYGILGEWADVSFYGDVPVYNYAKHVNGTTDVAFDKVNILPYPTTPPELPYDLSAAEYAPSTKTCSNVSCHQQQTTVTWGMPYRWWDGVECDRCHQYSN
jgi:predicted CxxxxCH...CXXCH cytochrome family protein